MSSTRWSGFPDIGAEINRRIRTAPKGKLMIGVAYESDDRIVAGDRRLLGGRDCVWVPAVGWVVDDDPQEE